MFEQVKGFFTGQNEQEKSDQENSFERIKSKYGLKIASIIAGVLLTASAVEAQDSTEAQFKNKNDEPTLSVGEGATLGPDIRPLGIQKGDGIMQVELKDDYTINIYHDGKFLQSYELSKGIQSIPYGKGITHTVIDKNNNTIWKAPLFTDQDIDALKNEPRVSLNDLRNEEITPISDEQVSNDQDTSEQK